MRLVDGAPTDARVRDPGIRAVFATPARQQRWLDVEAALALAQADCGLVPPDAAARIAASARIELIDADRLERGVATTGHALMPLVTELSRVVGRQHGGWVHWGATTQNIMQTGDVLGIRLAHRIITDELVGVLRVLADLGDRTADMTMAGRTHGQQAVPITFGFKVAAWSDALVRDLERLDQVAPRLFIAMAAGGAGTFAAMGPSGPMIQQALADRLGLTSMPVPSRSIADPFAELVFILGIIATTNAVIAEEITRLMAVEYAEVAEATPAGDVGSSTMPQKRNPKLCQDIISISAQTRALVPLALEAMSHAHEVDGARTNMMDEALEQSCILSATALVRVENVLSGLQVDEQRMLRNLDLSGGLIMAEAVMMTLASSIGRQEAHEAVHHAAAISADTGRSFRDVLSGDPGVTTHLSPRQLEELLNPASHTGSSSQIARDTASRIRHVISARSRKG
jgi:3-carboxy-cis,cis-muconate cycloisomerase